ncbi:sigma-70 family RNA polymerase sigma factor [Solirubrobacter sp. CPCC 204708]|uniref:RNA polymerase sigma factor n=1 Tax=Solirubrobacter deserti TaxID=2282478 RepID=A0ABT4RFP2_9ACTN|nr:sigma-70 family RNA polymerase sigma factor [Solirubrobacter deserti]MBE2318074.1 sigma-70 family RNA polymerase sigma factor [Solirubrobacter deserti]MDA0137352.1 sigma-70 family RNA polymerase sigma factor [Solirubrobacter deserti]
MGRGTSGAGVASQIDGARSPDDGDAKLVARVRRGDDRAFEVLYERYHRRIHAYVLGMVKDHGRAEDVTQEVFLSALRRMRETEQPLAFKPWLYQIAKNGCIDAFRRSKRAEEVSYDADDGLAPADHSKLVASGASPDAAVAAKQDLDSLCGAFGGLSETHHEILVLRELEGLSYAEIGRRMGMSRPAVESTLFRARRRLTEEYDDIVSGARCQRIQGIIVSAAQSRLGTRDTRRLARHLSHCQPCRREALAAGVDRELFARPSVRERVANRVAGLLPFPIFAKFRKGAEAAAPPPSGRTASLMQHMPMLSDHLHSGWGKAAAGAAVIVAGVGAGVGVKEATTSAPPPAVAESSTQRAGGSSSKSSSPSPTPAGRDERAARSAARSSSGGAATGKSGKSGSGVEKAAARGAGATGAAPKTNGAGPTGTPGGGEQPPATGAPVTPVAAAEERREEKPSKPKPTPTSTATPSKPVTSPVTEETKKAAAPVKDAVKQTTDAVNETVDQTTDAVEQTTSQVTEGLNQTTQQTTETVDKVVEGVTGGGPVSETVDKTTDAVDGLVDGTGKVVQKVVGGVLYKIDALTGQVIATVQLVTGNKNPSGGG